MTAWIGTSEADRYATSEDDIWLDGRAGADTLSAWGIGATILGGRGDDILNASNGLAGRLDGGSGDDLIDISGDWTGQFVAVEGGAGFDTLVFQARFEGLQLESLSGIERIEGVMNESSGGSRWWPHISGSDADNVFDLSHVRVSGLAGVFGNDGDDRIVGSRHGELIGGGRGSDTLSGGGGRDIFEYKKVSDSSPGSKSRDVITDFGHKDAIALHQIDADRLAEGWQDFTDIGHAAFGGHAGEVRYEICACGDTLVEADVNGDGVGDLVITLTGAHDDITFLI
jgi:Ca2+-binding RTX toxin-like protein